MTDIRELIIKNRSVRRFYQEHEIGQQTLVDLVELARFSASGMNRQPLKFYISCDPETNQKIFPHTRWAGYFQDWGGPIEGEKPSAYIIILGDKSIAESFGVDHGIAAQSIMMGAVERGLGGCIIGSIQRSQLMHDLKISEDLSILLVLAIGKPKEKVVIIDMESGGDYKYWRDENGVHYVPKRTLKEIILE
jgi:nitroreductase